MNQSEFEPNGSDSAVREFRELVAALPDEDARTMAKGLAPHTPGADSATADAMKRYLMDEFEVEAEFDLSAASGGTGSGRNTYRDTCTGRWLTHAQVLQSVRYRHGL